MKLIAISYRFKYYLFQFRKLFENEILIILYWTPYLRLNTFRFITLYLPQKPPTKMMEGFLNNSPKFNNFLLNLFFQLFSIKIVSLRQFSRFQITKTQRF